MKLFPHKFGSFVLAPACLSALTTLVMGQALSQALQQARSIPAQGLQNLVALGRLSNSGIFPTINTDGRPLLQNLSSLTNKLQEGGGMLRTVAKPEQAEQQPQPPLAALITGLLTGRIEAMQMFDLLSPFEQSLVATLAPVVDLVKMVNTGLELIPNPFALIDSLGVSQVDTLKQTFPCSILATVADQLEIGNPVGSQDCVGRLTRAQYQALRDILSQTPIVNFLTSVDEAGATTAGNVIESVDERSSEKSDTVGRRGVLGFDPAIAPELSSVVSYMAQRLGVSLEGRPVIPSIQNIVAPLVSLPRDATAAASEVLGLGIMRNESSGDKKEENSVTGSSRSSGQQYLFGNLPVLEALRGAAAQAGVRLPLRAIIDQ